MQVAIFLSAENSPEFCRISKTTRQTSLKFFQQACLISSSLINRTLSDFSCFVLDFPAGLCYTSKVIKVWRLKTMNGSDRITKIKRKYGANAFKVFGRAGGSPIFKDKVVMSLYHKRHPKN